jgi:hypothetical protein
MTKATIPKQMACEKEATEEGGARVLSAKGREGKGRAATTTNKRRQTRRRKQGQAINSSCDGRVLSFLAALLSEGGARDATERPREERSEKVTVSQSTNN